MFFSTTIGHRCLHIMANRRTKKQSVRAGKIIADFAYVQQDAIVNSAGTRYAGGPKYYKICIYPAGRDCNFEVRRQSRVGVLEFTTNTGVRIYNKNHPKFSDEIGEDMHFFCTK